SVQREARRLAAEIRGRVERLAIDRPVVVLASERREPVRRRKGIVHELAVARQHLGAAIEPGALANIDTGAALLVDHVRSAIAVNGPAAAVLLGAGLGARGARV